MVKYSILSQLGVSLKDTPLGPLAALFKAPLIRREMTDIGFNERLDAKII